MGALKSGDASVTLQRSEFVGPSVGDELVQALGVIARHVGHDIDAALELEVAAMMVEALGQLFLLRHRLEIDH